MATCCWTRLTATCRQVHALKGPTRETAWRPHTFSQEGTPLMSLSMGDVSASGPFFTCPRRAALSRDLAPKAYSAEGARHSRTGMKSL